MRRFARAAALLLLVFLLSTIAFAAEDCYPICYSFTPPEGFALVEGETAMWANENNSANINIIVEENTGINPYDLTEADIAALRDATVQVFSQELSAYQGTVVACSAQAASRKEAVHIWMDSTYVMDGVEIQCRQEQYVFFTTKYIIYVTGTALTNFADSTALNGFAQAAADMGLNDALFTGPTEPANSLVAWVIVGGIVGAAGGLTLFLLRQRKKASEAQPAEAAK